MCALSVIAFLREQGNELHMDYGKSNGRWWVCLWEVKVYLRQLDLLLACC